MVIRSFLSSPCLKDRQSAEFIICWENFDICSQFIYFYYYRQTIATSNVLWDLFMYRPKKHRLRAQSAKANVFQTHFPLPSSYPKSIDIVPSLQTYLIQGMHLRHILVLLLLAVLTQCKLIYLFSMIRHGAMYPVKQMYNAAEFSRVGGNLTVVGIRQQYNLGTYLKAMYIDQEGLVSADFNPNQVEFFSSNVARTSTSALSFIYGFYPLKESLKLPLEISQDLLLPPYAMLFPDHLQSQSTQTKFLTPPSPHSTLTVLDACENYDNLLAIKESKIKDKLDALLQSQNKTIQRLMKTFKLTQDQITVDDLTALYKVLYSNQHLGLPLPQNYTAEDRRSLDYIYKYSNSAQNQDFFARTVTTPALQFFGEKMRAASNKSRTIKMGFVFMHESGFWPFMYVLNLTSPECIRQQFEGKPVTSLNCVEDIFYSSNILYQLHEDIAFNQHIRVKYNGRYVKLCQRDEIECPVEEFLQRMKDMEIQYKETCKLLPNTPRPVHHRSMRVQ